MYELRTAWVRLGPVQFLDEIAGAFMVEIGRAWHAKTLEVRHEHFASACLSDFLRGVREPYDHRARGPRIVAAMLPGEEHEGGLLIASALLAFRGYRVVYLGASTPVEQIAAAAQAGRAGIVAVSVSAAMSRARSRRGIASLRRTLPTRVELWVGGAGAPAATAGVYRFESLAALDDRLTASA
jgi:methanogenic corrinoid protein MtbC1